MCTILETLAMNQSTILRTGLEAFRVPQERWPSCQEMIRALTERMVRTRLLFPNGVGRRNHERIAARARQLSAAGLPDRRRQRLGPAVDIHLQARQHLEMDV